MTSLQCLQFLFYLNFSKGFNNITLHDVVKVDKTQATFHAHRNFFHVVFITFQGIDVSRTDHNSIATHLQSFQLWKS